MMRIFLVDVIMGFIMGIQMIQFLIGILVWRSRREWPPVSLSLSAMVGVINRHRTG